MFNEIEESVCFLITFMYGKVPKSRIDFFAELLCNFLTDKIYENGKPMDSYQLIINGIKTDRIITKAAENSFIFGPDFFSFFPSFLKIHMKTGGDVTGFEQTKEGEKEIYPFKRVQYVANPVPQHARPIFLVETTTIKTEEFAYEKPTFKLDLTSQTYSAQSFAGTRFGSTRLKTNVNSKNYDGSVGQHPFTMPSVYAYLRLLVFLNATACAAMFDEEYLFNILNNSIVSDDEEGDGDLVSSKFMDDEVLSDQCVGMVGWV